MARLEPGHDQERDNNQSQQILAFHDSFETCFATWITLFKLKMPLFKASNKLATTIPLTKRGLGV